MENKGALTKILAIAGCLLAWFPLLAPVFFSLGYYLETRIFRFDYLMPAELFPLAFIGAGLLFWAAMRARSRAGLVGWGIAAALGLLAVSQWLASITGLDSGDGAPQGIWWSLVLVLMGGYALALAVTAAGGVLLLVDVFKRPVPIL
jgi:hypothetical protein